MAQGDLKLFQCSQFIEGSDGKDYPGPYEALVVKDTNGGLWKVSVNTLGVLIVEAF
jgi:hypothetical protein